MARRSAPRKSNPAGRYVKTVRSSAAAGQTGRDRYSRNSTGSAPTRPDLAPAQRARADAKLPRDALLWDVSAVAAPRLPRGYSKVRCPLGIDFWLRMPII